MPGRYKFDTIFTYSPTSGAVTPKFNVVLNGAFLKKGTPIYYNGLSETLHRLMNGEQYTGGINLRSYVGRSIAGTWDNETKTLTINGFY